MKRNLLIILYLFLNYFMFGQYNMQNLTVYDCQGTLKDSESNGLNPSWYSHNENFNFTICPPNALQTTITFISFSTEPNNDYLTIYDGPDNTYPILGGPFSGTNLPPQIISSGCITLEFISDQNVAEEGFELMWETDVSIPTAPNIMLPTLPSCSTSVLNIELSQAIHCDSVMTADIYINGIVNQTINPTALNCINDSTNMIQLNLSPGLNQSGVYDIYFSSFFTDDCSNIWELSSNMQFVINDCPLEVDLFSNNTTICLGDCVDLYVNVNGGDSNSYNYVWNPLWLNSPGIQTVCPTTTTQYIVTVDDNLGSTPTSDSITITVISPPQTQNNINLCQNSPPINLTASPIGGLWNGIGITDNINGTFNPNGLPAGNYTIDYGFLGCTDNMDITILEIFAGDDISACPNAPTFNLNTSLTTPGGVWSGNNIQANGDINVGGFVTTIQAIYTTPNGCSDTLLINVEGVNTQSDDTVCQNSGNHNLSFTPSNGTWSVIPNNPQQASLCQNPITNFPYHEGWESGLSGWSHDPNNDFNWTINSLGTPSGGTGPQNAKEGYNYIYTEASNPNNPDKTASIISPCINLSEYSNPVLHFWFHKYGAGQGGFIIDVSTDNGLSWNWNHWSVYGDLGNQWNEASIDLSNFNNSEVKIRLRVITGNWQSDVAIDQLSILAGPVTPAGVFLSNVANSGTHNLIYSVQGCDDYVNIYVKEINAGNDTILCPTQSNFNILGIPSGGIWSGTHIINQALGTFDPSLGNGLNLVTYSLNGCTDTAEYLVVDTDIQIDTLILCINSGIQSLDMNLVPRSPWNGIWNGNGIISTNFPGEFNPMNAGTGDHIITYSANTCTDSFIIKVLPSSYLQDTLICSSSNDVILNIDPAGGYWNGNGIINNNIGLFSPSSLSVGNHFVEYTSLEGCIDTFTIEIYDSPNLEINGLDNYYCFKDTLIYIVTNPSGGTLSGNGIIGNTFNPSLAGSGYHNISYSYGTGECAQTIDNIVFIENNILTSTFASKDTICSGDLSSIGVSANGGTSNYTFTWNNNLSNSFEHLISPSSTTEYIVTTSDGCSEDKIDTINIYVHPSFSLSFNTSEKKCYGETGFAEVIMTPNNNYIVEWNTSPPSNNNIIYEDVNKRYNINVTDLNTNCIISDTITIPGYDNIFASFLLNTTECISLLNSEIQCLNNSLLNPLELSNQSYWEMGDGTIINFENLVNPTHLYTDTGKFKIKLTLINKGQCIDTFSQEVCIISENKLYTPNIFTPDGDNCNDEFYISGLGIFENFNINIYNRWGGDPIFESNEILQTNTFEDNNLCNDNNTYVEYYKMGSWDGKINGKEAMLGTYSFIATYDTPNQEEKERIKGYIILMR